MSDLSGLVQGLAQGLNGYLQGNIQQQRQQQNQQFQSDLTVQAKKTEDQNVLQMQGQMTPDMAKELFNTISPDMGAAASKTAQDFFTQNNRYATTDEATKLFDPIMKALSARTMKEMSAGDKESKEQDALEKQAMDRLTQVRGDQSLMRSEHQRDSAGMAYDTLSKALSENRPLTELEQTDLIGQLWQARTGKAPTDQDMKSLNDQTLKRGFNHMVTYLTGNPSLVGASTPETMANLKQFVMATGQKADQQWSAYMQPRMVKPTSLHQDRWDHVVSQHRGISFGEQMATSDKTYGSSNSLEAKKAALRAKLEL